MLKIWIDIFGLTWEEKWVLNQGKIFIEVFYFNNNGETNDHMA